MRRLRELIILLTAVQTLASVQANSSVTTNSYAGAFTFAGQTNASSLTNNVSEDTFSLESQLFKFGVDSSSSAGRFMASGWSTNGLETGEYFQFSLTVEKAPGVDIDAAYFASLKVDFSLRRSSSGPRQFQWRWSSDNFASFAVVTNFTLNPAVSVAGGVLTLPSTGTTETFGGNSLSLLSLSPLAATNLTLRLYGFQAESQFGQGGLDSPLGFSGNVVVPEPSTVALLAFTAAAGVWWRLRRRN